MNEVDKDLSERYRAAARDEPPQHLDAAILAASKRAVGAQPKPAGAPSSLRRWYVPVSLAAVIVLSVVVTLRVEQERPEMVVVDAVPMVREKKQEAAAQVPAAPVAAPQEKQRGDALPQIERPRAPAAATGAASGKDAVSVVREKIEDTARQAAEPSAAPRAAPPVPRRAAEPDAKPAEGTLEARRADALRSVELGQARGPAAAAESASGSVASNVAQMAKTSQAADAAKRELAPADWLERIAELRKAGQDKQADEELAEFKRRYPDYKIPEPMIERIAPRK